jgi:hypothetical protein
MTDIRGPLASIAFAILLSLIATFDAQADDSKRLEAAEARAKTLAERVQALEAKTNYFTKTTRRVRKIFRKNRNLQCEDGSQPTFVMDLKIPGDATSYLWPKIVVTYRSTEPLSYVWLRAGHLVKGGAKPCYWEHDVAGASNGTATFTGFCSLDVTEGDVEFSVGADSGGGKTPVGFSCSVITKVDATLKMVNIQIAEPPDR